MRHRLLLAILAFVLGLGVVPHRVCERHAEAFFDGETDRVARLAAAVEHDVRHAPAIATGSARFDGEWRLATYAMAAIGFGQIGQPARMEPFLDAILREGAFDREAWGEEPFDGDRGHMGYLGWAGLPFAIHRSLAPWSRFTKSDELFAAALERRFLAHGMVETYPGETYPADNAMGLAALALFAKHAPGLSRGLDAMRARGVDPATGLLRQSIPGPARGSGTALAAWALAYADEALAASLYRALRAELFRTVIGFGGILEKSSADIDSGPVVFGFGVSATGFALGASRAHGDREAFRALYASAHLFGAPDDGRFATGGAIGNAILFAMLTAPRRPS